MCPSSPLPQHQESPEELRFDFEFALVLLIVFAGAAFGVWSGIIQK